MRTRRRPSLACVWPGEECFESGRPATRRWTNRVRNMESRVYSMQSTAIRSAIWLQRTERRLSNPFTCFLTSCLVVLFKDTTAIHTMYFYLSQYDANNYPFECHNIIEAINHTTLQILKHISKMKLQELEFHAGRSTAHIVDTM